MRTMSKKQQTTGNGSKITSNNGVNFVKGGDPTSQNVSRDSRSETKQQKLAKALKKGDTNKRHKKTHKSRPPNSASPDVTEARSQEATEACPCRHDPY
jgi:hypothetical protein